MRYAMRTNVVKGKKRTSVYMHAMLCPQWEKVDHRNGDGLDNRRRNLRRTTEAQNQMNRRKPKNNTSGFKGVGFIKARKRWRATIRYSTVRIVGHFPTAHEAALAYDTAARQYHGKFARLNFPRRGEQQA
jgi:hypothetical protein